MLHRYIEKFFDYCRLANFSIRSVQALTARLNEFDTFLKNQKIRSIKKVSYQHLAGFVADYKAPSIPCHQITRMGHAAVLSFFDATPNHTQKYCHGDTLSKN